MKKLNVIWIEIDGKIDYTIAKHTRFEMGCIAILFCAVTISAVSGIIEIWPSHTGIVVKILYTLVGLLMSAVSTTSVYYAQDRFFGNFCKDTEK